MGYLVVFQYTKEAGGYAGIRFIVSYQNKDEFVKMNPPDSDKHLTVIAEGVSDDDAQDLLALNPEVCHLTAAVQEMCYAEDGHVDPNMASFHLQMVIFGIAHDRQQRQLFAVRRGSLPTDFPFVEIGPEDSDKNRLYRFIKEHFDNPNGTIGNLESAVMLIACEITNILYERAASLC